LYCPKIEFLLVSSQNSLFNFKIIFSLNEAEELVHDLNFNIPSLPNNEFDKNLKIKEINNDR